MYIVSVFYFGGAESFLRKPALTDVVCKESHRYLAIESLAPRRPRGTMVALRPYSRSSPMNASGSTASTREDPPEPISGRSGSVCWTWNMFAPYGENPLPLSLETGVTKVTKFSLQK